jgi:hypothetical protein
MLSGTKSPIGRSNVTPIDVSSMKTVGLWKMPKPMNEEFLKASNIIARTHNPGKPK